jgi:hypothetical protein
MATHLHLVIIIIIIIIISCLGQTVRNFIISLDRRTGVCKMYQKKKNWRTFGEKYMGIKLNIIERCAG